LGIEEIKLHQYWIEFDPSHGKLLGWQGWGYGITAYSLEDALNLLREQFFNGESIPPVLSVIEDVDVSTLDAGHVRPDMGVCSWRGVWYPKPGPLR
jgi:hypothetical protein